PALRPSDVVVWDCLSPRRADEVRHEVDRPSEANAVAARDRRTAMPPAARRSSNRPVPRAMRLTWADTHVRGEHHVLEPILRLAGKRRSVRLKRRITMA